MRKWLLMMIFYNIIFLNFDIQRKLLFNQTKLFNMPVFVPENSKIKMVILTKGNENNAVWWSPIKENKRKSESIIKNMLKRFEKHALAKITNVIQFYENGNLIAVKKL